MEWKLGRGEPREQSSAFLLGPEPGEENESERNGGNVWCNVELAKILNRWAHEPSWLQAREWAEQGSCLRSGARGWRHGPRAVVEAVVEAVVQTKVRNSLSDTRAFLLWQSLTPIRFLRAYIFSNQKTDFPVCGLLSPDLNLWFQELGWPDGTSLRSFWTLNKREAAPGHVCSEEVRHPTPPRSRRSPPQPVTLSKAR